MKSPITDRPIRFALVGAGRISKNHLESIANHEGAELVGVCDTNPDRLQTAAEKYQAEAYPELGQMLQKSNADVVSVCTPSGTHPAQTIEIAKSGRHIVCEKPMATRWQDGVDMVKECEKNNVNLFVVKQNRHNSTLQMVKRAMEAGRFGRIYMVTLNVFWARPQDYYDMDAWRGTWEQDGGALMNQASHYIDLLDWLIGPVESVQAYTATLARNIEVEDTATVGVRWRAGALGSVNVTMLTYLKNLEGSLTIIGEKGTVRLGGLAVNEIQHWEFEDSHPDDEKIADASYQTTSVYGFGHPHYYNNVIETLAGKAKPYTDGSEGLKSLELLVASYMSSRENRRVSLPLEY